MNVNDFNRKYKGKTFEEIKDLSPELIKPFLDSRARRCINRGLLENPDFKKVYKRIFAKKAKGLVHRTNYRNLIIMPSLVGEELFVHNGKTYAKLEINQNMLGRKIGDFIPTKVKIKHSGRKGIGATKGSKTKAGKKS